MEINNNISSSILQKNLAISQSEVEKSIIKISSGKKISAVEDAANMVLSQTLEAQSRGSETAIDNSMTGMNMLQTADSGLDSINENLQRIRELSIQAANGTYSDADRKAIKDEIGSLTDEINRVAKSTSFNKQPLLDGSSSNLTIQTGANGDADQNSLNIGDALKSAKSDDLGLISSDNVESSLNTPSDFANYADTLDDAIGNITSQRANLGAYQNRLESNINSLYTTKENLVSSQSRITDTDVAAEMSRLTQNQILSQASASLQAQANQIPAIAMTLL